MRAVIFSKSGASDEFVLREISKPIPSKGEVLVKIYAVSINAADYRSMQMGMIPTNKIFGADIAGKVEAVGEGVSRFRVGDEVFGEISTAGFGGFADYAAAPEKLLAIKPAGVSFETTAAVPMAALTALQGLRDKGGIRAGQKVLIYGAGGGVGTFAVQIAKSYDAEVTALCSPRNVELARSLGADHVINYALEDFSARKEKYDLILGVNGNQSLGVYRRALAVNGVFVMVGGGLSQIFSTMVFGVFMSLGSKKMKFLAAKADVRDLELLIGWVIEGRIKPVIDRTYSLEQTAEAMNYLKQGHAQGKVVIKVLQE